MLIERKEIDLDVTAPILGKLNDAVRVERTVSLGKFVAMYVGNFSRSGGSVKQIYEYLKASGLDIGTYHSFRSACHRAGFKQGISNDSTISKANARECRVYIDPKTGAKCFDI